MSISDQIEKWLSGDVVVVTFAKSPKGDYCAQAEQVVTTGNETTMMQIKHQIDGAPDIGMAVEGLRRQIEHADKIKNTGKGLTIVSKKDLIK